MFSLTTTFNREDFTRLLTTQFGIPPRRCTAFFDTARGMNFYDDQRLDRGELFERFFPGREDVIRLLMEPITYANGSTLEDPAITYGIVFSNFMSQGRVHVRRGHRPADRADARRPAAKAASTCGSSATSRRSTSRTAASRASRSTAATIKARAVVSQLESRGHDLSSSSARSISTSKFVEEARAVRLNNSQHAGLHGPQARRADRREHGRSALQLAPRRCSAPSLLLSRDVTSRTYSFYYPRTRPQAATACLIVSSTNANYADWASLPDEEYEASKQRPGRDDARRISTSTCPNIRERLDHVEAATPRTFQHYTQHVDGASFGTKFEGLGRQPRPAASRCAACTTPAASASSCRAGWGR